MQVQGRRSVKHVSSLFVLRVGGVRLVGSALVGVGGVVEEEPRLDLLSLDQVLHYCCCRFELLRFNKF